MTWKLKVTGTGGPGNRPLHYPGCRIFEQTTRAATTVWDDGSDDYERCTVCHDPDAIDRSNPGGGTYSRRLLERGEGGGSR